MSPSAAFATRPTVSGIVSGAIRSCTASMVSSVAALRSPSAARGTKSLSMMPVSSFSSMCWLMKPEPPIEADFAVDAIVVQSDHQDEAVVEAGAADAPLIHERGRVGEVFVLADAGIDLGVDVDLGAGGCLHGIDPAARGRR